MMNGMPTQEGQAPQNQESVPDLASGIQTQLASLLEAIDIPQAKAALAQIIEQYGNFVEKLSGGSPEPQASVAPEAGANPNARPM